MALPNQLQKLDLSNPTGNTGVMGPTPANTGAPAAGGTPKGSAAASGGSGMTPRPAPAPAPPAHGLGIGAGLAPAMAQGIQQAVGSGTLDQFLAAHPEAAQKFQGAAQHGNAVQQQRVQGLQGQNAGQQKPPPTGNSGPSNTGAPGAGANKPAGAGPRTSPGMGPTYQQGLDAQFGKDNPLGMRGNYQDPNNPMYAGAQRAMQQQLAQTRARFAGNGLGTSGREALAEGDTIGNFGAQIAQLGEQAYQNDANRGLGASLGAGQQNLAANQQLANLGTGLTGIGASEQTPAGLQGLMGLLSGLVGQSGNQSSNQAGSGGWWTK